MPWDVGRGKGDFDWSGLSMRWIFLCVYCRGRQWGNVWETPRDTGNMLPWIRWCVPNTEMCVSYGRAWGRLEECGNRNVGKAAMSWTVGVWNTGVHGQLGKDHLHWPCIPFSHIKQTKETLIDQGGQRSGVLRADLELTCYVLKFSSLSSPKTKSDKNRFGSYSLILKLSSGLQVLFKMFHFAILTKPLSLAGCGWLVWPTFHIVWCTSEAKSTR